MFAPHLPWRDEHVRAPARRALGRRRWSWTTTPTAPRAPSARYGAARGARDAVVRHARHRHRRRGRPRRPRCTAGRNGMAGEFGHMQVVPGRPGLRVRRQRLLGAVLQRQRPGPLRPRADRPRADRARGAVRRQPGPADRPDGDRGRRGRRPGRPAGVRRRSATGSASGWPTSSRPSTPRSWSSAAGSPRPATGCSSPARDALAAVAGRRGHRVVPPLRARPRSARGRAWSAPADLARAEVRRGGSPAPARWRAARGTARRR